MYKWLDYGGKCRVIQGSYDACMMLSCKAEVFSMAMRTIMPLSNNQY